MKILIKIITFLIFVTPISTQNLYADEKIKIGLLIPLSGKQSEIGKSIMLSVRLAINKINNSNIEILPKDTKNDPIKTLIAAKELEREGVKIVIGPIFNKNLIYLDELKKMIFLSLTNKNINNPKNIISAGINAHSQINTIIKFQKLNDINRTIFLIPDSDFKEEIVAAISQSKIKLKHTYIYETDPTLLTKQIEKITAYPQRKQNLKDEIKRLENSNDINKKKKIENLKKKDTLGGINFDSVIISDLDEGLKSIATSLLYTDVSPQRIYYITLNQWFDETLLKESSANQIYFPSINLTNYFKFRETYFKSYNKYPPQISILSYDILGLIYYIKKVQGNNLVKNIFNEKISYIGEVGEFSFEDKIVTHKLDIYQVFDNQFLKIN